jgi:lipoic acid synthetase
VRAVYKDARPLGNYDLSLSVLKYVKENSDIPTKSGLMIGLGETVEQIVETFRDLKSVGCDILTVGQYIQPSKQHLEVSKYYKLEEYEYLRAKAKEIGFEKYQIAPLVRSSYHAKLLMD